MASKAAKSSPILTYADLDALQNIIRAVRNACARADASTGIHIHIDGALFDVKSTTNLVKNVHKQERLLEHALGVSETRLARYCRPIDPAFIERLEARRSRTMRELSEAWYGHSNPNPQRYHFSRHHGLNLNSLFFRGTIEFRHFNGSQHAGEVKAYLQLVLAMAAKAITSRAASSKRREFNIATAKYDFRVFLLGLGLIGPEFKTARLHLTKRLAGSAAWKGERRDRRPAEPTNTTEAPVEPVAHEGAQHAEAPSHHGPQPVRAPGAAHRSAVQEGHELPAGARGAARPPPFLCRGSRRWASSVDEGYRDELTGGFVTATFTFFGSDLRAPSKSTAWPYPRLTSNRSC